MLTVLQLLNGYMEMMRDVNGMNVDNVIMNVNVIW